MFILVFKFICQETYQKTFTSCKRDVLDHFSPAAPEQVDTNTPTRVGN